MDECDVDLHHDNDHENSFLITLLFHIGFMSSEITTNLRKMRTSLNSESTAQYDLPIYNVLEERGVVHMNALVGQELSIHFDGEIHCVESGKKIKKPFGEGLAYDIWLKSPQASPSIIRPELSRIHEGIALRDFEWEQKNHNQPHYVYLSRTSGVKVGVTRTGNKISRWIDQGAIEGILLAETPYRQLAGLIEVSLKDHIPDKTAWQAMLRNESLIDDSLVDYKNRMIDLMPSQYGDFFCEDDTITAIQYPVLKYPSKVKSMKLDQISAYTGTLSGIKGQYLIFSDNNVLNIRTHAGYRVKMSW
jgi:hypothetical protein